MLRGCWCYTYDPARGEHNRSELGSLSEWTGPLLVEPWKQNEQCPEVAIRSRSVKE